MDTLAQFWPPFALNITAAAGERKVILRVVRDDDLVEMSNVNEADIYGPELPPYAFCWLNGPYPERVAASFQFRWNNRAQLKPESWSLDFVARDAETGEVIGGMDIRATNFAENRTAETGSWVLYKHQGIGYGSLIRHALIQLAFDVFGASRVETGWHEGNTASARVSEKLGYSVFLTDRTSPVYDGSLQPVIGAALSPDAYRRSDVTVTIDGVRPELAVMLGFAPAEPEH